MYKVTVKRMKIMLIGSASERAVELEKYLNEEAPEGYELVQMKMLGIAYMFIWKKI